MSLRIDYDERAISQAAAFLDYPHGIRAVLDAIDRLADDPRPAGSFPYGAPDLRRLRVGPCRWAHVQGVAARARSLAPVLGADADLLEAAAWLHDIGYAPGLAATGLHALDGARYLRDAQHADILLCRLVAHHSCAIIEASEPGQRLAEIHDRYGPGHLVSRSIQRVTPMILHAVKQVQDRAARTA